MTQVNRIPRRSFLLAVGGLGLGGILLLLLLRESPSALSEVANRAMAMNPLYAGAIIAGTFMHFYITSHKWRLITEAGNPDLDFHGGYFRYTALGALLGQVMPAPLSVLSVRSLAMRYHHKIPIKKGAAVTVLDQMFDFLIAGTLAIPAICVFRGFFTVSAGYALSVALLLSVGIFVVGLGGRMYELALKIGTLRRFPTQRTENSEPVEIAITTSEAFPRPLIIKLYLWSIVRYGNLLARSYFVVLGAILDIPFAPIAFAHPIVITSAVIGLTPANVGVAEWGWVSVIVQFGVPRETALFFALLNRLLTLGAVCFVNFATFAIVLRRRSQGANVEHPKR